MLPVPRNPEPLAELRQRYPRALQFQFDMRAIIEQGLIRPGECAANVFDFDDGLRLIVSRELLLDGRDVLHVSASFAPQGKIADEMRLLSITKSKEQLLQMWRRDVPRRFRELSGDERALEFLGWSDGNVPHWFVEEPE